MLKISQYVTNPNTSIIPASEEITAIRPFDSEQNIELLKALHECKREFLPLARAKYDLASAHLTREIITDLPFSVLSNLLRAEIKNSSRLPNQKEDAEKLQKIMQNLIEQETSITIDSESRLIPRQGNTRESLNHVLTTLTKDRGRIALPIPNWHFWYLDGPLNFSYFCATSGDELIENFKKQTKKEKISALLLVSPANPLMYTINKDCAKELDAIALSAGVDIIVDDVLKGVHPVGQRESIAAYFTAPIVVEGFSKRFGDKPLGKVSYILLPKQHQNLVEHNIRVPGIPEVLEAAIKYSTDSTLDYLRRNNKEFDEGFLSCCSEMTLTRPTESHLMSLIQLPQDCCIEAYDLCINLWQKGIVISPVSENFYPENYKGEHIPKNLIRVSVGKLKTTDAYEVGQNVAQEIIKHAKL